jgi:hypothetical protein
MSVIGKMREDGVCATDLSHAKFFYDFERSL